MIKLNKDTKKAKNWLDSRVEGYILSDVYSRYSTNKEKAYADCIELCKEKDGYNLCIIGHNCNYFTVKFTTNNGVYIITYMNNYFIEL